MRTFNYSAIKEQKWDSDVLGLIAAIDSLQYAQLFRGPRLFIRAGAALLVSLRKLAHSSTVEPL